MIRIVVKLLVPAMDCCTINWRAYGRDHLNNLDPTKFVINSLDLGTETYTQMLPPPGCEDVVLAASGVCVLMNSFCFYHDFNGTDLVIWQMTEFGDDKSWTQFLKFSYNDIPMNYDFGRYPDFRLTPLYLSENGDTVVFVNSVPDRAIIYNRRTNKVKKARINKKISWSSVYDYVESLVSTS
ncbi:F-box associated protein [Medicago truncatula]|uniref:F-box associated protein n=1 Tax=Medicago truncatula TaxID=3880 RepID=G7L1A4_MEDTR|nr:F-box associated protein [Medicago truncatula]